MEENLEHQNGIGASSEFIGNKTGELRIMFYNIYGYKWYPDKKNQPHLNSGPILLRQRMETELIKRYAPDVLGMQEYSPAFHRDMTIMLEETGYVSVDVWHTEVDKKGNRINFTPLFYRPDRLNVLDKGYLLYDGPNDVNSKSLTWAVFEDLQTSKCFVAICTHFMWSDPTLESGVANATRVANAKQLLNKINEICQLHSNDYKSLSVIMGGDLNCRYDSDPFRILRDGDLQWMYEIAKKTDEWSGLKGYATYDETKWEYVTCPVPEENSRGAIDYMWLKQGSANKVHVSAYITVTDREACLASDHCPRFADITL